MRVLAIGAHPDDVEIFMFGTLAAFRAQGDEVVLAVATDGSRGGGGDPDALATMRRSEAAAAAALLGVKPRFLGLEDGEVFADRDAVTALRDLIRAETPDLVLSHASNDYHGDHRALAVAVRLAAGFAAPVLACDTLGGIGPQPTFYVDITAHMDLKCAAIRCHRSQDPERFVQSARQLNAFRAAQCRQVEPCFAEAFHYEPIYPFVDIRALLPPAPPIRPVQDRGAGAVEHAAVALPK